MTPTVPDARLKLIFENAEERYLRSLPLEHFMEASAQGKQREITLESFAVVSASRPEIQLFNELLVQYPKGDDDHFPGQVVPDNMVVIHSEPIQVRGSFNTPLQPVGPFMTLEYVSKYNKRKDYEVNFTRYERDLAVPYYLLFYPDNEELSVFRLTDGRYTSVTPNAAGRLAVPELELEVAMLGPWVRFWFRGELVPLPADLLRQRDQIRTERDQVRSERDQVRSERDQVRSERDAERAARAAAERRAADAERELERLRAKLAGRSPPDA